MTLPSANWYARRTKVSALVVIVISFSIGCWYLCRRKFSGDLECAGQRTFMLLRSDPDAVSGNEFGIGYADEGEHPAQIRLEMLTCGGRCVGIVAQGELGLKRRQIANFPALRELVARGYGIRLARG